MFLLIFEMIKSVFNPNVSKSISAKTGVKPQCNKEDISEDQVKGGTITSPPLGYCILSN